jgi:prepilin-type N-terminal cleavage/methylation domain-containing protein
MVKKRHCDGFTLFELLGTLLILAIILSITLPKILVTIENSKLSTIEVNASNFKNLVNTLWLSFENKEENLFSDSESNENKFSEYIEKYLGAEIEINGEYTNLDRYKNPYGADNIFNWYSLGAINYEDYKHRNPAVFITRYSRAKYDSFSLPSGEEEYFRGTIIVYMKTLSEDIEIYYINNNLEKSDNIYKISLK